MRVTEIDYLTGGPASPVSPFLPFLPRLPGGPGGPKSKTKKKFHIKKHEPKHRPFTEQIKHFIRIFHSSSPLSKMN